MTTITLKDMAKLRRNLLVEEERFGLTVLSHAERDVYYAASDLPATFRTADLIEHQLSAHIARPTFFRALKSLTDGGYLIPVGRGQYTVKEEGKAQ